VDLELVQTEIGTSDALSTLQFIRNTIERYEEAHAGRHYTTREYDPRLGITKFSDFIGASQDGDGAFFIVTFVALKRLSQRYPFVGTRILELLNNFEGLSMRTSRVALSTDAFNTPTTKYETTKCKSLYLTKVPLPTEEGISLQFNAEFFSQLEFIHLEFDSVPDDKLDMMKSFFSNLLRLTKLKELQLSNFSEDLLFVLAMAANDAPNVPPITMFDLHCSDLEFSSAGTNAVLGSPIGRAVDNLHISGNLKTKFHQFELPSRISKLNHLVISHSFKNQSPSYCAMPDSISAFLHASAPSLGQVCFSGVRFTPDTAKALSKHPIKHLNFNTCQLGPEHFKALLDPTSNMQHSQLQRHLKHFLIHSNNHCAESVLQLKRNIPLCTKLRWLDIDISFPEAPLKETLQLYKENTSITSISGLMDTSSFIPGRLNHRDEAYTKECERKACHRQIKFYVMLNKYGRRAIGRLDTMIPGALPSILERMDRRIPREVLYDVIRSRPDFFSKLLTCPEEEGVCSQTSQKRPMTRSKRQKLK
jgi:hypothetical protein